MLDMRIKVIIKGTIPRRRIEEAVAVIQDKFKEDAITFERTEYPGQATILAKWAVDSSADKIIIMGGDGTINEVINGLGGSKIPLGIIPAGTANDLAAESMIPVDIMKAVDIIRKGFVRDIDLIRVNGWDFITVGGCALPCQSLALAEKWKCRGSFGAGIGRILKSKIYLFATVPAFVRQYQRRCRIILSCNDQKREIDIFSLIIANQMFLGGNFRVAPGAVNNDGRFDLFLIKNGDGRRPLWKAVVRTRKGLQPGLNNVVMEKLSELEIESERPLEFFGDGEIKLRDTKFHVRVIPRAVKVIVPGK